MVSKEMDVPAASAGRDHPARRRPWRTAPPPRQGREAEDQLQRPHAAFQIDTGQGWQRPRRHIYLYSKVVEGNYPNYQQVIPKETHQRIKLERELFLQCVHRAALVCSEKSNSVKIKLTSNLLEITAQSPDFGEAHESMAIGYSGPDLQVAFNPPSSWIRSRP
jgi:DNA polymerase-3 subunit beta